MWYDTGFQERCLVINQAEDALISPQPFIIESLSRVTEKVRVKDYCYISTLLYVTQFVIYLTDHAYKAI